MTSDYWRSCWPAVPTSPKRAELLAGDLSADVARIVIALKSYKPLTNNADNPPGHRLRLAGQRELSQDLLVRNPFAPRDRPVRFVQRRSFFLRDPLGLHRHRGQGSRDGIGHHFEQLDDGSELGRFKLIEQLGGRAVCQWSFVPI